MNAIAAERRIRFALTYDIPSASDRVFKIAEDVLIDYENKKKLVGLLIVGNIDGKMITAQRPAVLRHKMLNTFQVEPFLRACLSTLKRKMILPSHHSEIIAPHNSGSQKFETAREKGL